MSDHYFSPDPQTVSRPRQITVDIAGQSIEVTTDAGVFSPTRLDPGTQVLVKNLPAPPPGNLLDLGCGWGPISLQAALEARADGTELTVWALDVNERSLRLTALNAQSQGIHSIRPVTADQIPSDLRFDAIWSNPPIRVGKEALHELLLTWLPRLNPGGEAWLAVSKNLGADSLTTWLAEALGEGYSIAKRASAKGFRVLVVTRER